MVLSSDCKTDIQSRWCEKYPQEMFPLLEKKECALHVNILLTIIAIFRSNYIEVQQVSSRRGKRHNMLSCEQYTETE